MHQVLFGSVLLISFLGGVVALLAPCCVSVMLPAFFATGFGRRSGIAAATGVFAAGVATLIVPIGLGASAVSAALPAHHLLIFTFGGAAMAVSVTYVAGMVAPLAVLALVWERRDWGSSRLLLGRRVRLGPGRLAREMPLGTAASGAVLLGMGILTLVTAVTGPSMSSSGWRETMTAFLQHASSVTARALTWLPGWAVLLMLAGLAAALAAQAVRVRRRAADADTRPGDGHAAGQAAAAAGCRFRRGAERQAGRVPRRAHVHPRWPGRGDPLARRLRRPAAVHHVPAHYSAAGRHQGRGAPVVTAITLLTQADCALCGHAKEVLARVGGDHPLVVTEIDLASEQGRALADQARVMFAPGVLVDGRPFGYGRLSERKLRRTLERMSAEPH